MDSHKKGYLGWGNSNKGYKKIHMYGAEHTKILMVFEEVISFKCHNHFYFSLQYPENRSNPN